VVGRRGETVEGIGNTTNLLDSRDSKEAMYSLRKEI
jgi:hypothetical protein